jgi:hypothetical protein
MWPGVVPEPEGGSKMAKSAWAGVKVQSKGATHWEAAKAKIQAAQVAAAERVAAQVVFA